LNQGLPAGKLGNVVGQGDGVVVIRTGIVGESALGAQPIEIRQVRRTQCRDGIRSQTIHADMNDMSCRLGDGLGDENKILQDNRHKDESGKSSAETVEGRFHCFILRNSAR
jgi:hypothetical protein